ncbi:MAG: molybdopterin molybdotransferase MoeA [Polyangiaceae bacterium]|nr:molybdopterin molybdotransferase MoeA [Polyangiaceae bacterium]
MLTYEEALAKLLGSARPIAAERVGVDESTGRVLAEDIVAHVPMPAFDYSSMDGYAVNTDDLAGAGPWDLPVIGESAAGGELPTFAPHSACRIFTGAPTPQGTNAVIPQENVERTGDTIRITHAPKPFACIRMRGEDLAQGAIALRQGTRMNPGHAALAAALDHAFVLVARRPVVTILCSGDELRSPGTPGRPGSIAESNGIFVAAAARRAGAIARVGAYVPDRADVARDAVAEALRGSDLVVTIGGVSVGDHDVMRGAFEAAGVTLDFWRVAIKPGKPIAVGRAGQTQVIGLPGNPASASLTWYLFGAPLVRAMQGDGSPLPRRERLEILGAIERSPGREEFVRAKLEASPQGTRARILANQASGAVTSFARANVLVVVPKDMGRVEDGSTLEAIRIDEF